MKDGNHLTIRCISVYPQTSSEEEIPLQLENKLISHCIDVTFLKKKKKLFFIFSISNTHEKHFTFTRVKGVVHLKK